MTIIEFPKDAGRDPDVIANDNFPENGRVGETPVTSWEEINEALLQFLDDITGGGDD